METIRKLLLILDYIVNSPKALSATEIAKKFGMSVSNAFKYLATLQEFGFLVKNSDKTYMPGFKLVEYGSIILKKIKLRDIAHPHLVELLEKTNQTVHLVLKEGAKGVYIEKLESAHSLPMLSRIGMSMPLYSTSFGKAILAFLPEEELSFYFETEVFEKKTANTITDPDKIKKELDRVRERGYAIDNEENELGIRCIGAPIFNHEGYPVGAVSISGPSSRITDTWISQYALSVVKCAEDISRKLGYKKDKK